VHVSFVIPLYHCLDLTQACVASLQAALPAGLAHEIILVDDGSTDGTRAWLATLRPPFRVVLNERNLGYAGANNRGAALATGRILALLNNDLVLKPHWLEPMLAAHRRLGTRAGLIGNVQRAARTGAVDHSGIFINLKGKPEHDTSLPPRWMRRLRPVRPVAALTGACMLLARDLWTQLGGFDENFRNGGEDVDLCFRARAAGRVNAIALRSVIDHHISASVGRKKNDEHNSRRLALRWRPELEQLALRAWCWDFLRREWSGTRDPSECATALEMLLYAANLRRTPPAFARDQMHAVMNREFERWAQLLDGPAAGPSAG
jgi:GT2 family glycosyltransferase